MTKGLARQADVVSEIARLRTALDREAAAVHVMLAERPSTSAGHNPLAGVTDHKELRRQLAALHAKVAEALGRSQAQPALRAELATLLSFAKTLRTDAEVWRAACEDGLKALQRERRRLAAEREALMRQRDALRSRIDETAARMAQDNGGECRRTMPCFTIGGAVTVCSVTVMNPRKGFRCEKRWLVTLNESGDDVVVRRSYG